MQASSEALVQAQKFTESYCRYGSDGSPSQLGNYPQRSTPVLIFLPVHPVIPTLTTLLAGTPNNQEQPVLRLGLFFTRILSTAVFPCSKRCPELS